MIKTRVKVLFHCVGINITAFDTPKVPNNSRNFFRVRRIFLLNRLLLRVVKDKMTLLIAVNTVEHTINLISIIINFIHTYIQL